MNSFQEEVVALSPRLGPSSPIFWRNVHDKKKTKQKPSKCPSQLSKKVYFSIPIGTFGTWTETAPVTFRTIADLSKYLASRDFRKSKLKNIGVYHAAGFFNIVWNGIMGSLKIYDESSFSLSKNDKKMEVHHGSSQFSQRQPSSIIFPILPIIPSCVEWPKSTFTAYSLVCFQSNASTFCSMTPWRSWLALREEELDITIAGAVCSHVMTLKDNRYSMLLLLWIITIPKIPIHIYPL